MAKAKLGGKTKSYKRFVSKFMTSEHGCEIYRTEGEKYIQTLYYIIKRKSPFKIK